jgi:hypothetical protein
MPFVDDGISSPPGTVVSAPGPGPERLVSAFAAQRDYRLIQLAILPTFDPLVAGAIWNNAGTPTLSAG